MGMSDRRIRVTIDARYLRRPAVGISIYLADLIDELVGDELAVTLLTTDAAHADHLAGSFPGRRVEVLGDRRQVSWEQWLLPRYLRRTAPDAHIAGANRGLPWASPAQTKLILVVHDLIPLRMPRTHLLPDPFGAARYLLGTTISLARADLVVANSRSTAADVRRLRPHVRTVVRYPAVEIPATDGGPPDGWPADYLLYCGGADRRKNVEALVEAHAEFRRRGGRLPLVIMGFGFDRLRPSLARASPPGALVFTGLVSPEVKWRAMRHARAVLYPSTWEGFGLPILEALAVGTPVLAGRGGAQPEVGGDAAAYVDVRDPEALVNRIFDVTSPAWSTTARQRGPAQVARIRAARQDARRLLRIAQEQP